MMIDRLPGATNVVRFPIEERGRPTLELMRMLSPDVRTLDLLAEGYGLELPPLDFRDRVDAEAAAHIADHIDPDPGERRSEQLRLLLDALVVAAVEAGRASRRAWAVVGEGRRQVTKARREGGSWVQGLEEQLNGYEVKAAKSSVEAHVRAEEAEGVARAVQFALAGETWTPRDVAADMDALMAG